MTFSGGEPFLRGDLPDIILSAVHHCQPAVRQHPHQRVVHRAGGGRRREDLHGQPRHPAGHQPVARPPHPRAPRRASGARAGSYDRLMDTLAGLRALNLPNLTVGVHTVVSNANEDDFPAIAQGLSKLGADSYIAEPAEERVELQTIGHRHHARRRRLRAGPRPPCWRTRRRPSGAVARMARAIRDEYYGRVARFLDGDVTRHAGLPRRVPVRPHRRRRRRVVVLRAGPLLRQPARPRLRLPQGVVLATQAEEFRTWMRERRCACPLANAAYTNLLVEPGGRRIAHAPPAWSRDAADAAVPATGRAAARLILVTGGSGFIGRHLVRGPGRRRRRPVRALVRSTHAADRRAAPCPRARSRWSRGDWPTPRQPAAGRRRVRGSSSTWPARYRGSAAELQARPRRRARPNLLARARAGHPARAT